MDPSPTAEATRLTAPARTSPTANTPGKLVSRRWGGRASGQRVAAKSSGDKSVPVLMNPFASSKTQSPSQRVFGTAPVITKTCRTSRVSTLPVRLFRNSTRARCSLPSSPTISVHVCKLMAGLSSIRRTRYRDMLAANPSERTSMWTHLEVCARNTAA